MAEVKLENISKFFERHIVGLKDFSLHAKEGEFVTILGPSGSGKSTALRVIAGLERQDKGRIFIDGIDVTGLSPQERDVAFVFQSYALYPHMDVYENIAVGLRIKGHSRQEIQKRVYGATELLEIGEFLKRRPKALSGGQRQRVALARAIAKRPKVFLLDEPLSNLDALLRERMRTELKSLFNKIKGTVIYVTHDQQEAMGLSDTTAIIDKGILQQVGTTDELYYHPKNLFVASFLGSPRLNTFEAAVDGESLTFGSVRWKIPANLRSGLKGLRHVIFGIRPEDIRVNLAPKSEAFPARVFTIERITKYAILGLDFQNKIFKALAEQELARNLKGGTVWIEFDEKGVHIFDIDTKMAL